MNKTKVTFLRIDPILAALIRALAVQIAGFQAVGGMTYEYLQENGCYRFDFTVPQQQHLAILVDTYLSDHFKALIKIESESN